MSSYYSHYIWSQGLPHWVPATRDPFFKLLHIVQQTSEIRTRFDFRSKPTEEFVHQIDAAVPKWEPYLLDFGRDTILQSFAPAQKVLSAISLVVEYHTDVERRLRLRHALPPAINAKAWTFNLDELWPLTYESFLSAFAKDYLQAAGDVDEPMDCDLEYPDTSEPETSTASPQDIFPEQHWGDTETLGSQSPTGEGGFTKGEQNADDRSGNPGSQDSHAAVEALEARSGGDPHPGKRVRFPAKLPDGSPFGGLKKKRETKRPEFVERERQPPKCKATRRDRE
ncbi:hypothetical protein FA13DRAFT_1720206 [Coprinellus micaceus]|uniref:Uncharacterized protein n=1 Tax=Coprinellus micaceus TaxID=71717 RepID=A0A4Y7SA43_COPMI|nr:hypothetical protein FA13DRAFT_1720206 [Coprinellus micaceus]